MSFTYTTLKQSIQDYTQNDETTFLSQIPLFIELSEERILKNVQLSLFRRNVSGSFSSSNKFLAVPSDFLAPMSLSFTNSDSESVFLEFKDADFIQSYNPNPATTGIPRYYAVFDVDNFIVSPTPNSSFSAELHYLYRQQGQTPVSYTHLTLPTIYSV